MSSLPQKRRGRRRTRRRTRGRRRGKEIIKMRNEHLWDRIKELVEEVKLSNEK